MASPGRPHKFFPGQKNTVPAIFQPPVPKEEHINTIHSAFVIMYESITEKDAVQQLWERSEKMQEKQP